MSALHDNRNSFHNIDVSLATYVGIGMFEDLTIDHIKKKSMQVLRI